MTVEIYTTRLCATCHAAKALLREKGIGFREIDVSADDEARQAMTERTGGRRSVPQIFIDGRHVGGFEELESLVWSGGLAADGKD
jgi:glutaredoxin 3